MYADFKCGDAWAALVQKSKPIPVDYTYSNSFDFKNTAHEGSKPLLRICNVDVARSEKGFDIACINKSFVWARRRSQLTAPCLSLLLELYLLN